MALLPLDDPEAPKLHTLFSVGMSSCLLDFRPEWQLRVFRDELAITGEELLTEGVAFRRGRRMLLQMATGTRGSLRIGTTRLLFKWEIVPDTDVGDVPLRDLGDVPRCYACGLAMRDALPREGLFARCDACRAINRFVDPEAPYKRSRERSRSALSRPFYELDAGPTDTSQAPALEEEADTMLGVPIFAPTTRNRMDALPEHLRPAGVAGPPLTPPDLRAARAPMKALEGMQTVLSRSPFLGPRPPQRGVAPEPTQDGIDAVKAEEVAARAVAMARREAPPAPAEQAPDWLPRSVPTGEVDPIRERELEVPPADPEQREPVEEAELPALQPPSAPVEAEPAASETPPEAAPVEGPAADPVDPVDPVDGHVDEELLDDAFYGAEVEALLFPESIPDMVPIGGAAPQAGDEDDDQQVPWGTFSVLSADARFVGGSGRIPRNAVDQALQAETVGRGVGIGTIGGLLVAVLGLGLLTLGVWLLPRVMDRGDPVVETTPPPTAAPTPVPTPAPTPEPTPEGPHVALERVVFDAGSYLRRSPDETQPQIVATGPFLLDRLEVTTADFELFLQDAGRPEPGAWSLHRPPTGSRQPVTGVSAADARAFCAWTSGRLPTEPEWERAAGGPSGRLYPWGDRFDAARVVAGDELFDVGSRPSGRTSAGVEDLLGSAVEWVDPTDGGEPFLKGGGASPWNRAEYLRVFGRVPSGAERWAPGPGFRCAEDP